MSRLVPKTLEGKILAACGLLMGGLVLGFFLTKTVFAAPYTSPFWSNTSSSQESARAYVADLAISPEGVDVRTGELFWDDFLFQTPGMDRDHRFSLRWRSYVSGASQLGYGVTPSWEITVQGSPGSTAIVRRPSGREDTFNWNGSPLLSGRSQDAQGEGNKPNGLTSTRAALPCKVSTGRKLRALRNAGVEDRKFESDSLVQAYEEASQGMDPSDGIARLLQACMSSDCETQAQGAVLLGKLATVRDDALAALVEALQHDPAAMLQLKLRNIRKRVIPYLVWLSQQSDKAMIVAVALERLGPVGEVGIRTLVAIMRDRACCSVCIHALSRYPVEELRDHKEDIESALVWCIREGEISESLRALVHELAPSYCLYPLVLLRIDNGSDDERRICVHMLPDVAPSDSECVSKLVDLLGQPKLRHVVARTLGTLGQSALMALNCLSKYRYDPFGREDKVIAQAIRRIACPSH